MVHPASPPTAPLLTHLAARTKNRLEQDSGSSLSFKSCIFEWYPMLAYISQQQNQNSNLTTHCLPRGAEAEYSVDNRYWHYYIQKLPHFQPYEPLIYNLTLYMSTTVIALNKPRLVNRMWTFNNWTFSWRGRIVTFSSSISLHNFLSVAANSS